MDNGQRTIFRIQIAVLTLATFAVGFAAGLYAASLIVEKIVATN